MLMLGTADTMAFQESDRLNFTPGEVKAAGDIIDLGKGVQGAVGDDVTASGTGHVDLVGAGCRWARTGGTTVFEIGDDVYLDTSPAVSVAITPSLTLDGAADQYLGMCVKAKASGEGDGVAYLPRPVPSRYSALEPNVYEFDCEDTAVTGGDTDEHVLIPAAMNKHGLVIEHVFALVSEVMAGSSEDQGIVTIEDGADNVICTLTPSDAAADALNDYIPGLQLASTASGAAAKVVAAGVAVQGFVSQQTSGGSPAGKMKVYVVARPLV